VPDVHPSLSINAKKKWEVRFQDNVELAHNAPHDLDVVMLGDSIIARWASIKLGKYSFFNFFNKKNGAEFEGLTLAIRGDKAPNLLWRIRNGEIPENLNPKVWWILIGTNDLGLPQFATSKYFSKDLCSEEVVVAAIVRVVREVQKMRPDAAVVVNGLLPRSNIESCQLSYGAPVEEDNWLAVKNINKMLKAFCDTDERLHYFDAGGAFIAGDGGSVHIPKELMYDCLHPTKEGYKRLGELVVEELHHLI